MTGYLSDSERQLHFVIGVVFTYSLISTYGRMEQRIYSERLYRKTRVSRRTRLRYIRLKGERLTRSIDDQVGPLLAKEGREIC
jgi:hypothetical protein